MSAWIVKCGASDNVRRDGERSTFGAGRVHSSWLSSIHAGGVGDRRYRGRSHGGTRCCSRKVRCAVAGCIGVASKACERSVLC